MHQSSSSFSCISTICELNLLSIFLLKELFMLEIENFLEINELS